jgi:hypothetical protein
LLWKTQTEESERIRFVQLVGLRMAAFRFLRATAIDASQYFDCLRAFVVNVIVRRKSEAARSSPTP